MLRLIDRFLESDTSRVAGPALFLIYSLALLVVAVALLVSW